VLSPVSLRVSSNYIRVNHAFQLLLIVITIISLLILDDGVGNSLHCNANLGVSTVHPQGMKIPEWLSI
jgi:hypothetical protein